VESAWCRIVCILILSSVVQCEVLVKGAANSADSHPLILHVGIYVYMYSYLYIYIYIYIFICKLTCAHVQICFCFFKATMASGAIWSVDMCVLKPGLEEGATVPVGSGVLEVAERICNTVAGFGEEETQFELVPFGSAFFKVLVVHPEAKKNFMPAHIQRSSSSVCIALCTPKSEPSTKGLAIDMEGFSIKWLELKRLDLHALFQHLVLWQSGDTQYKLALPLDSVSELSALDNYASLSGSLYAEPDGVARSAFFMFPRVIIGPLCPQGSCTYFGGRAVCL
jgi:hypothetical protein